MRTITKSAPLTLAPILLLGATLDATAGKPAEVDSAERQAAFQQFLQQPRNAPASLTFSPKASATCNNNLFNCTGSSASTGTILSCAADYFIDGVPRSACTTALNAAGGTCAQAVTSCNAGTVTLPTGSLALAGSTGPTGTLNTTQTCPTPHRVRSITVERYAPFGGSSYSVTKLVLTCTNGQSLSWGYGGTSAQTYTCGTTNLLSGLLIRAGSWIDAVGSACGRVASTSSATVNSGPFGGPGGSEANRVCGTGKFIVGARVYFDPAAGAGSGIRVVRGIEPRCR